jgi:transcriptional regulator with XRE-family HTH domain
MPFDTRGFQAATGELLRRARKRKGYTQEDLALWVGISRASYASIENGRQRIPVDVIWRIALHLNLKIEGLLPGPSFQHPGVPLNIWNPHSTAIVDVAVTSWTNNPVEEWG